MVKKNIALIFITLIIVILLIPINANNKKYIIKGKFNSTQKIQIIEKNINNTIFIKGDFYSTINYLRDTKENSKIILQLNLYQVELKIYNENKIISQDKYDKYQKKFQYLVKNNLIDINEEDKNPWNFLKILIILNFINQNFKENKEFKIIYKNQDSLQTKITLKKNNNIYQLSEEYKDIKISEGKAQLYNKETSLEYKSFIDNKKINTQFSIKSFLIVKLLQE